MLHLLLVEDHPAEVLLFQEALRRCSISAALSIACDGEQALRILGTLDPKPDLIVLDLNLPKFSGFDLLKRFQELRLGCPVVVFSASSNPKNMRDAFRLGAKDYVVKPLIFKDSVDAVHQIVERWAVGACAA